MRDVLITCERVLPDGSVAEYPSQADPFIVPETALVPVHMLWCTVMIPAKDLTSGMMIVDDSDSNDLILIVDISISPED
jgi:hypothetical protein